ncbi:MAG: tetratricopeptide repeat protein [Nannocystaceae bacterium]
MDAAIRRTSATEPGRRCLDDNVLCDLVEGRLSAADRARVDEHLDACHECRRLLAATVPDDGASEDEDDDAPLRRGAAIDRYQIVDVLGAGGMGIVYLAHDRELDRRIALKVLRTLEHQDTRARVSVLREAQAMARLVHPNVIAVHDVGVVDGRVFLVMDYVDGAPLSRWLDEEGRGWREVVAVFLQAGQGLAAAHAAGLVHRDFKPENVLVAADGRVLVGDFGLARAESDLAGPGASGRLVGTPAYMAPEILVGEVDARADVFAFAVALWEALYRQHPYGARVLGELGPLAPPPRGAGVPPWVRAALVRGLDPDPESRTPSMVALLADLDRDPAKRRRSVAAITAVVVAIAGAVLVPLALRDRPCAGASALLRGVWDDERRAAVRDALGSTGTPWGADSLHSVESGLDAYAASWAAMREEACAATRIRGEQSDAILDLRVHCLDERREGLRQLVGLLADADAETALGAARGVHSLPRVNACADVASLTARVPPPDDPTQRARVDAARDALARVQSLHFAGRWREGEREAAGLVESARALGYKPLIAEALITWSLLLDRVGEYERASAAMTEALYAAEAGRDRRLAATAMIERIWLDGHQLTRHDAALESGRHAHALLEGLGGDDELRGLLLSNESAVYGYLGRYDEAEATAREALRLREAVYGHEHFQVAIATNNLAATLAWMGRDDEALGLQEEALALYERIVGPRHPQTLHTLVNVASSLSRRGRLDEAWATAERARDGLVAAHGPEHAAVAAAENMLGLIAMAQERPAIARAHFERAIAIGRIARGDDHPTIAHYTGSLGEALGQEGRRAEAIVALREAIERCLKIGDPVQAARDQAVLARVLLDAGEAAEARVVVEDALAVQEAKEPNPRIVAEARLVLARALLEAPTDLERARILVDQALTAAEGEDPEDARIRAEAQRVLDDPRLDGPRKILSARLHTP